MVLCQMCPGKEEEIVRRRNDSDAVVRFKDEVVLSKARALEICSSGPRSVRSDLVVVTVCIGSFTVFYRVYKF